MQNALDSAYLREQAEKCVRLANCITDAETIAALRNMAMEYRIRARRLDTEASNGVEHPSMEPPT